MNKEILNDRYCDYNNFKRARYFYGMLMSERDFREEQIYHIEKRKMLNKMLHGWGVVCGLGITGKTGGSTFSIGKGMALDCHGNEIVVCEPYSIDITSGPCMGKSPSKTLDCKKLTQTTDKSNVYYIGIRYKEIPTDSVPAYVHGGGCEEKACDNSRIHEGFCIKLFDVENPPEQPQIPGIDPSLAKRLLSDCYDKFFIRGEAQTFDNYIIQLSEDASSENDYYVGMLIKFKNMTRTISGYDGTKKIATVSSKWESSPNESMSYIISNLNCLKETLKEFADAFCNTPPVCPECCPDKHYIILGKIEMNAERKIITLSNDDRSYVMTTNLFKYIFSSFLNGLDSEEKIKDLLPDMNIPDINLMHANPIQAICWISQIILNPTKNATDTGIILNSFLPEFHSLEKEVANLNQTVEKYKEEVTNLRKNMEKIKSVKK